MGIDVSKLPRAYQDQIGRQLIETHTLDSKLQTSKPKSTIRDESLEATKVSRSNKERIQVSVTQFTRGTQDPDNCCPKYEIDCLREEGIFADDTNDDIKLCIDQIKVQEQENEGVLIEIEWPE